MFEKMNPYTLIAGYHRNRDDTRYDTFFQTWLTNVCRLTPQPQRIIIIADSGARPPLSDCHWDIRVPITVINLFGNLGCCHDLLVGNKPHHFSGWTGVVLAGAMLAYTNETDMVFYEEDVISVGDVIGQMDKEIGEASVIFGNTAGMPCAQSLFRVRHEYLPEFARLFLSQGRQEFPEYLGENIFERLETQHPIAWKRFSFGYDRTRPINYDDKVWYAQHWKPEELAELKKRGMI